MAAHIASGASTAVRIGNGTSDMKRARARQAGAGRKTAAAAYAAGSPVTEALAASVAAAGLVVRRGQTIGLRDTTAERCQAGGSALTS